MNIATKERISVLLNFFKDNITWKSVDESGLKADSDTGNKYGTVDFYFTDNICLRLKQDSITSNCTVSICNKKDNSSAQLYDLRGGSTQAQIYKTNDKSFAVSFYSGSTCAEYRGEITIVCDTDEDGNIFVFAHSNYTEANAFISSEAIGTIRRLMLPHSVQSDYGFYNSAYAVTQLAPFVEPYMGKKADHLHTVLYTNYSDSKTTPMFIKMNGVVYLINSGFAIPIEGEMPTYKYWTNSTSE